MLKNKDGAWLRNKFRKELDDCDYLDKLTPEELEWREKFSREYDAAHLEKDETGDYSKDNLHKTKEERKALYDANNARNRCMLTRAHARGLVDGHESIPEERANIRQTEDDVIEALDVLLGNEAWPEEKK